MLKWSHCSELALNPQESSYFKISWLGLKIACTGNHNSTETLWFGRHNAELHAWLIQLGTTMQDCSIQEVRIVAYASLNNMPCFRDHHMWDVCISSSAPAWFQGLLMLNVLKNCAGFADRLLVYTVGRRGSTCLWKHWIMSLLLQTWIGRDYWDVDVECNRLTEDQGENW